MKNIFKNKKMKVVAIIIVAMLLAFFIQCWERGSFYHPRFFSSAPAQPAHSASNSWRGTVGAGSLVSKKRTYANAMIVEPRPSPIPYQRQQSGDFQNTHRDIIRTANMNLQVKDLTTSISNIHQLVTHMNGLVTNSNQYASTRWGQAASANITLRVPVAKFDQALASLKKMSLKVNSVSTNANDITKQISDNESKIKNLQSSVNALSRLKSQAKKMSDIITLTDKISQLNGQIHQIQNNLQNQKNQVAMSTIRITLQLPPKDTPTITKKPKPWSYSNVITNAGHGLITGLQDLAIFFTIVVIQYLPLFIIVLLVFGFFWGIYRLILKLMGK